MTTIDAILQPPHPPFQIYPSERITCNYFDSSTPELVHHAALLRHFAPGQFPGACGTCGKEVNPRAASFGCGLCHKPVCPACARKDGYAPELQADNSEQTPLLLWNVDRRDFLIREMKQHAWNAQQARCGQCGEFLPDIAQTSIMNGPAGPLLMCDRPCAARALGHHELLPHGSYPTDPIRIVADPRHGEPQDWLNVHFEMSLPDRSNEVWSKADCRFGVELYADPDRYDFYAQCDECLMNRYSPPGRPHKWCRSDFLFKDKTAPAGSEYSIFSAQMLLGQLGNHPETLPGVYVRQGDPDCLDYWRIRPPGMI